MAQTKSARAAAAAPEQTPEQPSELQVLDGGRVRVTLGDKTYILHHPDLSDLAAYEVTVGPVSQLGSERTNLQTVRFMFWRSLLRENPMATTTLEEAGHMVPAEHLGTLADAMAALFHTAG